MPVLLALVLALPLAASPGPTSLRMRVSSSAAAVPDLRVDPSWAFTEDAPPALDGPAAARIRRSARLRPAEPPAPLIPPRPVSHEAVVLNGGLRRFTLTDHETGLSLEMGQVGLASRSPLVAPSPYGLLKGSWDWTGALDGALKLNVGAVGLSARYFYDDAPELDRRADAALDAAGDLAGSLRGDLAVDPKLLAEARGWFDYPASFDTVTLPLASALVQAGKTVSLPGPVDIGFAAGGLARFAWRMPNAVLDQTGGLRFRLAPNHSLGVFAGLTEGIGFVRRDLWKTTLANDDFDADVHLDVAPHFTGALWGRLPRLGEAHYLVAGGHQLNPMTGVTHARAGLSLPAGPGRLSAAGRFELESGRDIEFERIRGGGELAYAPVPGIEAYAAYSHEDFAVGNASLKNDLFVVGIKGSDTTPPVSRSAALELLLEGKDRLSLPPAGALEVLDEVSRLAALMEAVAMIREGRVSEGWARVREVYLGLDADMRTAIDELFAEAYPDLPVGLGLIILFDPAKLPAKDLAEILGDLEAKIPEELKGITADQLAKVASFLGTPEVYERLVVRFARNKALEALEKEPIDMFGQSLRFSAPTVLALAHIHALSLSPIPAMTAKDARESLDPYLLRKLKELSGVCPDAEGETAFAECAVALLPPDQARVVTRVYGDRLGPLLGQALSWHADIIRRELNRTLLELMVAAEALNDLAVDRGTRIGELDTAWLIASFNRMEAPARKDWGRVLSRVRKRTEAELKLQEKELRDALKDYGKRRLDELNAQGAAKLEVEPRHWAALLATYGDRELFAFVLEARSKLGPGATLALSPHPFPDMGPLVFRGASKTDVRLPPAADAAQAAKNLERALAAFAP